MSAMYTNLKSAVFGQQHKAGFADKKVKLADKYPVFQNPVIQMLRRYSIKFWEWFKADNWKWVFAMLIIAGIVHILAVLNVPNLAPQSSWDRLKDKVPINKMKVLNLENQQNSFISMLSPDVRYAICRYDLSKGSIVIKSAIPSELFSIAAYDHIGQNFYVISGKALQRSNLYMVVTSDKDTAAAEVSASEESDDAIVVKSVSQKGLILLRAPFSSRAYETSIKTVLENAICERTKS